MSTYIVMQKVDPAIIGKKVTHKTNNKNYLVKDIIFQEGKTYVVLEFQRISLRKVITDSFYKEFQLQ